MADSYNSYKPYSTYEEWLRTPEGKMALARANEDNFVESLIQENIRQENERNFLQESAVSDDIEADETNDDSTEYKDLDGERSAYSDKDAADKEELEKLSTELSELSYDLKKALKESFMRDLFYADGLQEEAEDENLTRGRRVRELLDVNPALTQKQYDKAINILEQDIQKQHKKYARDYIERKREAKKLENLANRAEKQIVDAEKRIPKLKNNPFTASGATKLEKELKELKEQKKQAKSRVGMLNDLADQSLKEVNSTMLQINNELYVVNDAAKQSGLKLKPVEVKQDFEKYSFDTAVKNDPDRFRPVPQPERRKRRREEEEEALQQRQAPKPTLRPKSQ